MRNKSFIIITLLIVISMIMAACSGNSVSQPASSSGGSGGGSSSASSSGGSDSGATSDDPLVIKFSHVVAEGTPKGQGALKFKELVEEKTNGRVKVEVYPSSQLYGDKDELENLQYNNVQFIAPSVTKLVGMNPAFQIVDLPFLFQTEEAVFKFWDGDGGQKLADSVKEFGVLPLKIWPNGFKQFTNKDHALATPADFEGLKFRAQAGRLLESQFSALGAAAHPLPFAEVYTALQQGTVDAQENTFNNIDTQKYEEVQGHLTVSNHGRLEYVLLTNTEFWEGLPDDLRGPIQEAVDESTAVARELASKLNNESEEKLRASGKMQFKDLNASEVQAFKEAMQPVYEEFGDIIGQDLIELAEQAHK